MNKRKDSYCVIGLMSGTSLDGLDLSYVRFSCRNGQWSFESLINKAIDYSIDWRAKLTAAIDSNKNELEKLHVEFGDFLGLECQKFIEANELQHNVDLIASHGHTIFHEPEKGITVQIGAAEGIVKATDLLVINDFRIQDVKLGGQGAPLVPVGDRLLFGDYEACLNLGGIANISFESNQQRIAFDISPANLPLNKLMRENFNLEYDKSGAKAKSGTVIQELVSELDALEYYNQNPPKSLGIEWMNKHFYPIVNRFLKEKHAIASILHSIVIHETNQIATIINQNQLDTVLITGGGAFNDFFIELLKTKCRAKIVLPSPDIISYKEAIIFAFLGVLNLCEEINTYKSVTGASHDSIGGSRTYPSMV